MTQNSGLPKGVSLTMAASVCLQDWPLISAAENPERLRTSPLSGTPRSSGKVWLKSPLPRPLFIFLRHLEEPEVGPELLEAFTRLVSWSVELMSTTQCMFCTECWGKRWKNWSSNARPQEFKVFFVLFKMKWTREHAMWFMRKAQDWLEGKESN